MSGTGNRCVTCCTPCITSILLAACWYGSQQRVTTLYGIIRGQPPAFFEGTPETISNLYFNIETETFEFYGPIKMQDDPLWISVTDLMQQGIEAFVSILTKYPENTGIYLRRLSDVIKIHDRELHVEEITGADKDINVIVDIFNKVNSSGTRLSKGDLALAKVCAQWPKARQELQKRIAKWDKAHFQFQMDWLLRCINTLTTGEAQFETLENVNTSQFREGLEKAERYIDYLLNLISSHLGLDHERVLGSKYAFPLMVRYLDQCGGYIADPQMRDRLLY